MTDKDYFPCHSCGRLTHIDDLDSKPEPHNQPDPDGITDWTRLECRKCYGPGYISNSNLVIRDLGPISDDQMKFYNKILSENEDES